ncbi:TetR/AcrR family transcriptional regulator [Rhodobacter viridis]|nr:TetR/AcrR family transcriptional regulator [Rhodobacter viridis]
MAGRRTRKDSMAETGTALRAAARLLFARDGYAATSVEAIAAEAGYTKGAFYAHFPAKAAIFLTVLEEGGRERLEPLVAAITAAATRAEVETLLIDWADGCSQAGLWPMTILEYSRTAAREGASVETLQALLVAQWTRLGTVAAPWFGATGAPVTLGALLHEIAYAPATTFVPEPRAGALMRLMLAGLGRG